MYLFIFLLFSFFFVAVTTCDCCAECRAVSVTDTLSEERVSNDKRGGWFYHLTAAANEQKISVTFTPALSLCACYYVKVAS